MKASSRERTREEMAAWIPLVSPTYQVISVLLHCFTAEKSHKLGRVGQKQHRLLVLRLNRRE